MAEPLPACPRCGVPPEWMPTTEGAMFGCDCDGFYVDYDQGTPEFLVAKIKETVETSWRDTALARAIVWTGGRLRGGNA